VIVGGMMTHDGYIKSEGGYLDDDSIIRIYRDAWNLGVRRFVTPLTRPEFVQQLVKEIPGIAESEFYSPGFGAQGGSRANYPPIAKHYVIVGRRLINSTNRAHEMNLINQELGL
jgi:orotidine-5'-phosphate decarboxylase